RRRVPRDPAHARHVPQGRRAPVISNTVATSAYLAAAVLFILSLGGLSSQTSARCGNIYGIAGMALACVITLLVPSVDTYSWITPAILIGAVIGSLLAARVQMTAMPELVAILHSFVGLAAVLVGFSS